MLLVGGVGHFKHFSVAPAVPWSLHACVCGVPSDHASRALHEDRALFEDMQNHLYPLPILCSPLETGVEIPPLGQTP